MDYVNAYVIGSDDKLQYGEIIKQKDGQQVTLTSLSSQGCVEHGTLDKVSRFFTQLQQENILENSEERLQQVREELQRSGTYWQTYDEVACGARLAWRNSTRCIGRLHWSSLQVRDMRHLSTAEEVFQALLEHIQLATNNGKIKPMMTVFAPQTPDGAGIRIWNPQLIRYAGYQQEDGSVLGDPLHVALTEQIVRLGWQKEDRSPFDVLPLVIQMPDSDPQLFEIPPEMILEVPIEHPRYPWFAELGLKWHALPAISNMGLEIGGVTYTAAPFNGWYMGTEIGARDLGDVQRYDMLPVIAKRMGIQMQSERTLWRDQALVELNIAVLHSFAARGIAIVDHHTASRQFMLHSENEQKEGRCVAGDWGWLVPPMSGSQSPVFHQDYENTIVTPNFFAQPDPWLPQATSATLSEHEVSFVENAQQPMPAAMACPFKTAK